MRVYRFYKDELGWFIDLKYFPFNRGYLAMVAGADDLLDILAKGKKEIFLQVATHPIPFADGKLILSQKLGLTKGAVYTDDEGYLPFKRKPLPYVWLCAVTLLVFWSYPKQIYYKVV